VVNIQGDEPLIDPAVIDAVAGALAQNEMSTAATRIRQPAELDNPNVVKVRCQRRGPRVILFPAHDSVSARGRQPREICFSATRHVEKSDISRASGSVSEQLAAFAFLKHLGIYGYRRETLLRLVKFQVSPRSRPRSWNSCARWKTGSRLRS